MPRPVAGLPSTPPQLRSPRFAHSMKQSSAVVSSALLFGRTSSRVTSLPVKLALAARRMLELAWPLNVLIQLWSGARFTRKRTKTRLSWERFSSNVGSLIRMIGMTTPRDRLAQTRERRAPSRLPACATAVTPEPFARRARHENARASSAVPQWRSSLRRSMAYRAVGGENTKTRGMETQDRVCVQKRFLDTLGLRFSRMRVHGGLR